MTRKEIKKRMDEAKEAGKKTGCRKPQAEPQRGKIIAVDGMLTAYGKERYFVKGKEQNETIFRRLRRKVFGR